MSYVLYEEHGKLSLFAPQEEHPHAVEVILHPEAKILFEGTDAFRQVCGAPRAATPPKLGKNRQPGQPAEAFSDYAKRAQAAAKKAGYDVLVMRGGALGSAGDDSGTAILNEKAVRERRTHRK